MRTVPDETAFEAPPEDVPRAYDYLRSKADPYAMMSYRSGEVYTRRDGAKWEWPAYVVTREKDNRVSRKHAFAYCDTVRYQPAEVAAAA